MIKIKGAVKIYHANTPQQVVALNDVNLELEKGDFTVVIGSNGSGKSTLLNAIAGTVSLSGGSILLNNENVTDQKDFERSRYITRVFQNPLSGTAPDLSILDNFRLAALRTKPKTIRTGNTKSFAEEVRLKVSTLGLGLENKLQQKMGSLSGGQRQALTLVMSVMDHAEILLMDEPTAALDPRSAETVMLAALKIISDFELTALMVTHNMKDAHRFGSRIIQMSEGKILRDIRRAEKNQLKLNDLFEWFI